MKWNIVEQGARLAFRPMEALRLFREHVGLDGCLAIASFIAFFGGLFASFTALPLLALGVAARVLRLPILDGASYAGMAWILALLFLLGIAWFALGSGFANSIYLFRHGESFSFPLCRRWPAALLMPSSYHRGEWSVALVPLAVIAYQLFAVFATALLCMDLLLTCLVAFSRTPHLAVLSGGLCAGVAAAFCPFDGFPFGTVVVVSAIAGAAAAYCWHPIAASLARPTSHAWPV